MIKKFEQFALNEARGQFGDLDRNFIDEYLTATANNSLYIVKNYLDIIYNFVIFVLEIK